MDCTGGTLWRAATAARESHRKNQARGTQALPAEDQFTFTLEQQTMNHFSGRPGYEWRLLACAIRPKGISNDWKRRRTRGRGRSTYLMYHIIYFQSRAIHSGRPVGGTATHLMHLPCPAYSLRCATTDRSLSFRPSAYLLRGR